jgi:hypothetical protein
MVQRCQLGPGRGFMKILQQIHGNKSSIDVQQSSEWSAAAWVLNWMSSEIMGWSSWWELLKNSWAGLVQITSCLDPTHESCDRSSYCRNQSMIHGHKRWYILLWELVHDLEFLLDYMSDSRLYNCSIESSCSPWRICRKLLQQIPAWW